MRDVNGKMVVVTENNFSWPVISTGRHARFFYHFAQIGRVK